MPYSKLSEAAIDSLFMEEALKEAKKAEKKGEVPVGAVLVHKGEIIARGHNMREARQDPGAHAEFLAIRSGSRKLKSWRLSDTILYVTLEPCLMCMGAIIQARIPKLVFAAFDPKAGACGSLYDVSNDKRLNHRVHVRTGVREAEASGLLKVFFSRLRAGKKAEKTKETDKYE
ncbi:MAG: nucleoside deaminase [Deltaproteobacteria bacterium]|nr:nucleoside deaminase [Deltaproteobacteria bacterium]